MFIELETRQRAIQNWEKLRIKLILLSMSDYKTILPQKKIEDDEEKNIEEKSCVDCLSSVVLSPTNKYKLAWEFVASIAIYVSLILDLYILAFRLRPLVSDRINRYQSLGSAVVLLNIVLNLFTAIPVQMKLVIQDDSKYDDKT